MKLAFIKTSISAAMPRRRVLAQHHPQRVSVRFLFNISRNALASGFFKVLQLLTLQLLTQGGRSQIDA